MAWLAFVLIFFVVFSGWCHFLLTTTKNNCCQSSMAVKPKKEWNFLKIFTASIVTSRLTFCVLKAIFKELNRWQSIPESVKVKKKSQSMEMQTHCTYATLYACGGWFGLFHLQTSASIHSSNKSADSTLSVLVKVALSLSHQVEMITQNSMFFVIFPPFCYSPKHSLRTLILAPYNTRRRNTAVGHWLNVSVTL